MFSFIKKKNEKIKDLDLIYEKNKHELQYLEKILEELLLQKRVFINAANSFSKAHVLLYKELVKGLSNGQRYVLLEEPKSLGEGVYSECVLETSKKVLCIIKTIKNKIVICEEKRKVCLKEKRRFRRKIGIDVEESSNEEQLKYCEFKKSFRESKEEVQKNVSDLVSILKEHYIPGIELHFICSGNFFSSHTPLSGESNDFEFVIQGIQQKIENLDSLAVSSKK